MGDRGIVVRLPAGARVFFSPKRQIMPAIRYVARALSPGVKRPGREADQ